MLTHAVVAAAVLASTAAAHADTTCTVEVGPGERFEQDRDAVVKRGEKLRNVTALRGRVIVKSGAEVDEAMAVGGDLVIEPGAKVNRSATSVGGDVELKGDAQVGESAVSLGGEVVRSKEARVGGSVVAFSVRMDERTLQETIAREVEKHRCTVVRQPAAGAGNGTASGQAL